MVLTATLTPGTAPALVDAYVVIQVPDGTRLSLQPVGAVPGIAPFATGFTPPPFSGTIFSYQFTGAEPPGLYSWFAALTQAGTLNVVGSIDQDSFHSPVTPMQQDRSDFATNLKTAKALASRSHHRCSCSPGELHMTAHAITTSPSRRTGRGSRIARK